MKKILTLLLALTLVISLAACSSKKTTDHSNTVVTGEVKSVSDSKVTLTLGNVEETEVNLQENMGEKPSGEAPTTQNGEAPSAPAGQQGNPPEKPEGDTNGQGPQGQGGPQGQQGNPPAKPEGDAQSGASTSETDGQAGASQTDGEAAASTKAEGNMPSGDFDPADMEALTIKEFVSNGTEETFDLKDVVITLADETKGSVSDLKVGDVIEITYTANNTISEVKVVDLNTSLTQMAPPTGQASYDAIVSTQEEQ